MLDAHRLSLGVELQRKSYLLLQHVGRRLDKSSRMAPVDAFEFATDPALTRQWLLDNLDTLPTELRPSTQHLEPFANLFSSFVLNSFELDSVPGAHEFAPPGEHYVESRRIPHLRPRKPDSAGRAHARRLNLEGLAALASDLGLAVSQDSLLTIAGDTALRENLALFCYGCDLLRRLDGVVSPGTTSLVLWRAFAWTPQGAPRKDFSLSVQDILAAEHTLATRLRLLPTLNGPTPAEQ